MVSKLERLRQGDVVELKSGLKARLNNKNKTIEMSDGRIINVGDDPDYFPKNEQDRKASLEKERITKEMKNFPGGETVGRGLFQFGQKGSISRGVGDVVDRLTNTGEDYLALKQAKQSLSGKISEENPYLSTGATAASFIPDIVATQGMSATKAAPLLTAIGSGSRIYDEPAEVAGESVLAAGLGKLFDVGGKYASDIAKRRGLSRRIAREGAEVEARNVAGAAEVEAANRAEMEAYGTAKKAYDRDVARKKAQFEADKVARENELIVSKNRMEQAKADLEREVAQLPERQAAAQREFSKKAEKYYNSVSDQIPRGKTINTAGLGAEEFIDREINKSALATTQEGKQASQVIGSIFGESEEIGGRELVRRLRELDKVIETSPQGVRTILDQFKRHMGRKMGSEIADRVALEKIVPLIQKGIVKDVNQVIKKFDFGPGLKFHKGDASSFAIKEIKRALNEYPPGELIYKLRTGELAEDLAKKALPMEKFLDKNLNEASIRKLRAQGLKIPSIENQVESYEKLVSNLANSLENTLANAEMVGYREASNVRRAVNNKFRQAYGLAEPLPLPSGASESVYPSSPRPIQTPPKPMPPDLGVPPDVPTPQNFTPEPVPTLSPSSGSAEALGDFLERSPMDLIKGRGPLGTGPVGKLAALKYLAGLKMAPAVGAYAGLKAITSPTAAGETLRSAFEKMGVQAIDRWAQRYPSYRNGILDDPMERRSLVKEIEDEADIPISVKALVQSQINRGKSLQTKQLD